MIIIDAGTSEIRAGYKNDLSIRIPPKLYKKQDIIDLNYSHGSVEKCLFDGDTITNFESFEHFLDQLFLELKVKEPNELIITEKPFNLIQSRKNITEIVFETYNFDKFQLGFDQIYSMKSNLKHPNNFLSISASNSCISCIKFDLNGKIEDVFYLNYGANQCKSFIMKLLQIKYQGMKVTDKIVNEVFENLKIAENYREECFTILNGIKNRTYEEKFLPSFLYFTNEEIKVEKVKKEKKKIKKNVKNIEEEIKSNEEEKSNEEVNEDEEIINEDEVKNIENKESKIAFYSALYRNKQKIQKEIEKLKRNIEKLIENYEIKTNLPEYIKRMKNKLERIKKEFKQRENILRELKNKKSIYSIIKNKTEENEFKDEEYEILQKIVWALDDDNFVKLNEDLEVCINQIKKHEPNFTPYEYTNYQLLSNMSIEIRKIPEIIFNPSIINLNGYGLNRVIKQTSPNKLFVCGGFSQISGMKERLLHEAQSYSLNPNIEIVMAKDPIYDTFNGAHFSDLLPIFTKDDYNEFGIDNLISRLKF